MERSTGFCIVSSDSDYTRLATRICEQGQFVMGVGQAHTPKAFVNACEVFVYAENLSPDREDQVPEADLDSTDWTSMVARAIDMATQEDGWAFLGTVGHCLRQMDPAFDPRTYGHKQLSPLVRSRPELFDTRDSKTAGPSNVDVRMKPKP